MTFPRVAIFDMDGLIFNTEELFWSEYAKILEQYGYKANREDYIKTIGMAGVQLCNRLYQIYGPDYPIMEISQKTRSAVNAHMEIYGPELKPYIAELLQFFKKNQVMCCVASSTSAGDVSKYLYLAGIEKYFDFVIGGDMVVNSKPNPEIFDKAFNLASEKFSQIGESPLLKNQCVILEDSNNGIRAAAAANIPVICIPDMTYPTEDILGIPAIIANSAKDALEYLEGSKDKRSSGTRKKR